MLFVKILEIFGMNMKKSLKMLAAASLVAMSGHVLAGQPVSKITFKGEWLNCPFYFSLNGSSTLYAIDKDNVYFDKLYSLLLVSYSANKPIAVWAPKEHGDTTDRCAGENGVLEVTAIWTE